MALKSELNAEMKRLKQEAKALAQKRDQMTADIDSEIIANEKRQEMLQEFMDATFGKKVAKVDGRKTKKASAEKTSDTSKRRTRKNRTGVPRQVLAAINASAGGIKRAAIISALGLGDDKAGHQYVSNVLTTLRNDNQIKSVGRLYFPGDSGDSASSDTAGSDSGSSSEDSSSGAADSGESSGSGSSSEDSGSESQF